MAHASYVDSAATQTLHYFQPSPTPSAGSAWFFNQSSTLFGAVYMSTLTGCNASGASVTLTFNGSNIFVFGSVVDSNGNDPPVSVYSVDGGSPTTFTAPETNGRSDAVMFFGSGAMPLQNHTLTINVTRASPAAPYYLDYLQFSIDNLPLSSPLPPPTSSTASESEIASSLQPSDSTVPLVSASASPEVVERKPTAPTGAIVGGVVGGLAVICLIIATLYWRRNRRPSGEFGYGTKAHQDAPPAVVPFVASSPHPLHGDVRSHSPVLRAPRASREASGSTGDDTMSQITSSGVATSSPSEVNATAPSQSEAPPAAPGQPRRRTFLSYLRPPSTAGEDFAYAGMGAFSERGGGSEVLPAYTPGP